VVDDIDVLNWLDATDTVKPAFQPTVSTSTLTSSEVSGISFEITREVLLHLLNKVMPVVPTRDIIPVLTNFQFNLREDELEIVASNSYVSMVVSTAQVDVKSVGTDVFSARTFLNVIKETNAGETIFVEVTATGLTIVAGSFSTELRMTSGTDFPVMDDISDITFHAVNREAFAEAVSTVKYALPNRDYSGVSSLKMINIKGGKFTVCDGSRFQQVRIPEFRLNMKIPANSISILTKMLAGSDQEILEIGETQNRLVFKLQNTVLFINKMLDPYPNVEQLWLRPALANDQKLEVNRNELITALKQIKTSVDSTSNAIGIMLNSDSLTLVTRNAVSKSEVSIGCSWGGKPRNIVINLIHLAQMLQVYTQPECVFMLGQDSKTNKSPILLKDEETLAIATIPQMVASFSGLC
jgi:DNA polymerase-3 subunit beta